MQRRKFIIQSSLAGSAAFFGSGQLEAAGVQMLNAKMLLSREEFQHLTSFAKEYDALLKEHPERPVFMDKVYWIDQLLDRKITPKGYEVFCRNRNGEYVVLVKKGNRKMVKVLKEI